MEVQCLSSDKFSTLPQDVIEKILILLPTSRDIVRMSILSKKWRNCWKSIPALEFANKFVKTSRDNKKTINCNSAISLLRILRLYTCPVSELTLVIELEMAPEIDKIILSLSRRHTLKRFNLMNSSDNLYKLPSSFFSLQGLEQLKLSRCVIKRPSNLNNFNTSRWLYLSNIKISAHNLKRILTNCPLLKEFYLVGNSIYITGGQKVTFIELFECLPSLVHLIISNVYMKYFAASGMPRELPIPRVYIRFLRLGVRSTGKEELYNFFVIKNSTDLANIDLRLLVGPNSMDYYDLKYLTRFNLDHLEGLEMVISSNHTSNVMDFVLHVMAKSPLLNNVRIHLNTNITNSTELVYRNLILSSNPRASPSINFIIDRQETSF